MTTTTDDDVFMRAIAESPDDEGLRLALADHLQETSEGVYKTCPKCAPNYKTENGGGLGWLLAGQPGSCFHVPCMNCGGKRTNGGILDDNNKGTGFVPDTSRADRAELIRVQVAANALWGSASSQQKVGWANRESAIIAANPDWLPKCVTCNGQGRGVGHVREMPCPDCSGTGKAPCTWRAGYVACVSVPTIASVLEPSHCRYCSGEGCSQHGHGGDFNLRCNGDGEDRTGQHWQLTDYARYLHANFSPTLTGVMPVDRVPAESRHGFSWYGESAHQTVDQARIPNIIWQKLPHVDYKTIELANTALSKALKSVLWYKITEEQK